MFGPFFLFVRYLRLCPPNSPNNHNK